MRTYFVGLTGGIGSGKSTISSILAEQGAYIIDADVVSRVVMKKGGESAIKEEFGERFFVNGELDRALLREYVFPDRVGRLNQALASLIRKEIVSEMNSVRQANALLQGNGYKAVFVVIPLLFEGGYNSMLDEVWSVVAEQQRRIKWVTERDNIKGNSVKRIIVCQISDAKRKKLSSIVFENNGTIDQLKTEVLKEYSELEIRLSNLKGGF